MDVRAGRTIRASGAEPFGSGKEAMRRQDEASRGRENRGKSGSLGSKRRLGRVPVNMAIHALARVHRLAGLHGLMKAEFWSALEMAPASKSSQLLQMPETRRKVERANMIGVLKRTKHILSLTRRKRPSRKLMAISKEFGQLCLDRSPMLAKKLYMETEW